LRSRQESLGLHELPGAAEDMALVLRVGDRIDVPLVPEKGEERGASMVPQAVPLDWPHVRLVAEGVHLQQGRELRVVGEVVAVLSLEVRGGRALGGDEANLLPADRVRQEREGEAAEVGSPAERGN